MYVEIKGYIVRVLAQANHSICASSGTKGLPREYLELYKGTLHGSGPWRHQRPE